MADSPNMMKLASAVREGLDDISVIANTTAAICAGGVKDNGEARFVETTVAALMEVALTADRASCQARVEELERALRMIQHDSSRYSSAHPYFVRIADAARSTLEGK